MNLANVPTWFWIAAAALAFLWLKRRGIFDAAPRSTPAPTAKNAPAPFVPQVVEIRHAFPPSAEAVESPTPASDPLTQTLRHSVDFQIDVKPVPKLPPPGASP